MGSTHTYGAHNTPMGSTTHPRAAQHTHREHNTLMGNTTHSWGVQHTHREHSTLMQRKAFSWLLQHLRGQSRNRGAWLPTAGYRILKRKAGAISAASFPSPAGVQGNGFSCRLPQASRAGRGSRQQVAWKSKLRLSSGPCQQRLL